MSLDITLTNRTNDEEVASMNWLRNSYGLCNWAEDNVKPEVPKPLWYVINHWSYDESGSVDRQLFKEVVDAYWVEVQKLTKSFFFFDLPAYIQFIEPYLRLFPRTQSIVGSRITDTAYDDKNRIAIPQEYFDKSVFNLGNASLDGYKQWFKELVDFAELLQDMDNEFYCSN